MNRKISGTVRILLIAFIIGALLTGCTTTTVAPTAVAPTTVASTAASTPTPAALKEVKLTLNIAGDPSPDQQAVWDEIYKVTKDELNIKLSVNYTPWGDYISKTGLLISSGEKLDIYLNFIFNLSGSVARKECVALDDLLATYGPDIKKAIPDNELSGLVITGKLYGIPAIYPKDEIGSQVVIRKDLRLKYKLPEIKTMADFELYLDTIKKNEPNMVPFTTAGARHFDFLYRAVNQGVIPYGFGYSVLPTFIVDLEKTPFKVENLFKSKWFIKSMEWNRKAYVNGWLERDILNQKDDMGFFASGKCAAKGATDPFQLQSIAPLLAKNVPGAELEVFLPYPDVPLLKLMPSNNFSCISSTSENPERAMMFLNWMLKSKDNYSLYMYGIKGKHYNETADGRIELPTGVDPANRPYNPTPWFIRNFNFEKYWVSDPQIYVDGVKFFLDHTKRENLLRNFQFDSSSVKLEYSQVEKVLTELGMPVLSGVMGTDSDYQNLLKKMEDAGIEKIIAESQKQLDAFISQQK